MGDLESVYSVYALYLWMGLVALVLLLGLWLLALQVRVRRAIVHYEQLVGGVDNINLEEALDRLIGVVQDTSTRMEATETFCRELDQGLQRSIQKVGVLRHNPFSDTGGDQSFCVALLDAFDDGLVLSSLFSRTETRVFVKPIVRGQSKYPLSEEELKAIELAGQPRQAQKGAG